MAKDKLIEIRPGKGLDSGIFPSAQPTSGAVWRTATNAWFRELHIEHVPGRTKLVSTISRSSKSIAQAYAGGAARFYYEDKGIVSYYANGSTSVVGALADDGNYDLEPYGEWLLATDFTSTLQLWKGIGTFAAAGDVATQFNKCKIIRKIAQHVLAFNTDENPSGFHWCSASNPELWTPSVNNSAGNLVIRDLDSEIVAVVDLGAALAVYSRETMLVVQYTGAGQWFGTPNQALSGIGAAGKHSVVSLGKTNYGLSKGGIFLTDGSGFSYIDRPAIDRWLQENVDWTRADEIVGYFNDQLLLVIWTIPLLDGSLATLAVDPKNKDRAQGVDVGRRIWTYLTEQFSFGDDRSVFDYPLIALSDGIYLNSVANTVVGGFELGSWLFDAGDQMYAKLWDYVLLEGTMSGQVRVGFTDTPTMASVDWQDWQDCAHRVPLRSRESVFFAIEFRSEESFKLSGLTVYGEKAGAES